MSARLPRGGRRIDRAAPVVFAFDGRRLNGYEGDTLASALLANDRMLVGRSFKYHRPRGVVASGPEEPNALATIGRGARREPNARATITALHDGLVAESQNRWPSLARDVGAINGRLARLIPAGFYYKTFIHPRAAWKHLFEPVIRRAAGLGRPPREADPDRYEQVYAWCDVLVAGGGIAGLRAALEASADGARVILLEQAPHLGGRAPVDDDAVAGEAPADWIDRAEATLRARPAVTIRMSTTATGVHDHGYVLACERVADHAPGDGRPRQRHWRIRAGRVVAATGAIERPLAFAGNDVPGVMLAGAVRDYVADYAVSPGARTVIVTADDGAYRTAQVLLDAGLRVPAILDVRPATGAPLAEALRARGVRVLAGHGVARVLGGLRVTGVAACLQSGEGAVVEEIACDAVAMSGGWSPAVHLWSHCGGRLQWDEALTAFVPDPARPPVNHDGTAMVACVGAAAGRMSAGEIVGDGAAARSPTAPAWIVPERAPAALRAKAFLDFQNDVTVADVQLAAREGFTSVEHAKRYTTLGMATDQGKLGNVVGLGVLARAQGLPVPEVGTTTFRPPYTPVAIGALAGEARGDLFQPLRRTPIHARHEAAGATFEPVGLWRRPYCYPRAGETQAEAVRREVRNTRAAVGLLDASTLGKIVVRGPDAGRFLDILYTNAMASLPVGRCRYGLMCDEQGFLMDDGVVARLSDDTWLCHTTTGGADRIHAWMEDWLQCEWWDWKVHAADVTEQSAQVAVVGPLARRLLESLGGMDVSRETLPHMGWAEGALGGIPARVYRISFSGELSYEVAVPAGQGAALWDACVAAGAPLGLMPYGTEALHVMRAEKGFVMIGDETDGTVTPQDLGLGWAVSRKKADFLGKRGQARPHLASPDRWRLVGFETLDGSVIPDGAYVLAEGVNENGQRRTQGRVTSAYHSPTLGRGIAMGLLLRGPERMGEVVAFGTLSGRALPARVRDPVWYDVAGERLDA